MNISKDTLLVTGTAGFIGFYMTKKLAENGFRVIGLDSINSYYDSSLKYSRLNELGFEKSNIEYGKLISSSKKSNLSFIQLKLEDSTGMNELFQSYNFNIIIHLGAQAGVRYSISNPEEYINSNILGFYNLIELMRKYKTYHFLFASSSSVYGLNTKIPFSEEDRTDSPVSLYAATKKSNEILAYSYSQLYKIPATGLRFFTVYGPWGRPDMAYFKFTEAIIKGKPIDVYNNGDMRRDFTYIDDIIEGIYRLMHTPPENSNLPFEIYNIGNNQPENLMDMISILEELLGKTTKKNFLPMQAGDVYITFADIEKLGKKINYRPNTSLKVGLKKFVEWYKVHYSV